MAYTFGKTKWAAQLEQNEFGDYEYSDEITITARKQPHQKIVKTAEGKELLSKSIFYVEPTEPKAPKIKDMDKLDGELILESYIMMDLFNKPKLYRFITV